MPSPHPLDASLALVSLGPGLWSSPSSPLYWNTIGPFGGWIAAVLLKCVLSEPEARGEALALQAQFIGPLRQAPFKVRARQLRQNRSTAFWQSEILQAGEDGGEEAVCAHATVTLGVWRETFSLADVAMPDVPTAEQSPLAPPRGSRRPAFIDRYEYRPVSGWYGQEAATMDSLMWVRDAEERTLDALAIAALADTPFPGIWMRLKKPVRTTTLLYNVTFRNPQAQLAAGSGYILAESRGDVAANGFYDQRANLWSGKGLLLAQTQQLAWFADKPLAPVPPGAIS